MKFNVQHQPNKPCFFLADHYVPPHVAAHFLGGHRLQAITSASCLSVDVLSSLRNLPWTSWFSNHASQLVSKLAMVQELLTPQAHGSFTLPTNCETGRMSPIEFAIQHMYVSFFYPSSSINHSRLSRLSIGSQPSAPLPNVKRSSVTLFTPLVCISWNMGVWGA